jgi:hypothetical protein
MANDKNQKTDFGALFDDPRRRRWWLLTKALEGAPLASALETALAADVFVLEGIALISGDEGDARPVTSDALEEVVSAPQDDRYRH